MTEAMELPSGTIVGGCYRISRVIGAGGFGITYEADDLLLETSVAIKEYFAEDFSRRTADFTVEPRTARVAQTFAWGRESFLNEARTLVRFRHPSIVQVIRVFEERGTAYMVMALEKGPSLYSWSKSLPAPPTQEQIDAIVGPVLDALEQLHTESFIHRDIAPDNIIIREQGPPVLLDFGSARRTIAAKTQALTGLVKAGYSPQEQYATDARLQGPWTDIYALGATLYHVVTGHPPEEATLRSIDDKLVPAKQAAKGCYRPGFLAGIDACLRLKTGDRPQSISEVRRIFLGAGETRLCTRSATAVVSPSMQPARVKMQSKAMMATGALAAIMAMMSAAFWYSTCALPRHRPRR